MSHLIKTVLACDNCHGEARWAGHVSATQLKIWMRKNGWRVIDRRDWCPACLTGQQQPANGLEVGAR